MRLQLSSLTITVLVSSCAGVMRVPAPFKPHQGSLEIIKKGHDPELPSVTIGHTKLINYQEQQRIPINGVDSPGGISFDVKHNGHSYLVHCYRPEIFLRACTMYDQHQAEIASFLDVQTSDKRIWDQPGIVTVKDKRYIVQAVHEFHEGLSSPKSIGRIIGSPPLAAVFSAHAVGLKHRYWEVEGLDEPTSAAFRAFSGFLARRRNDEPVNIRTKKERSSTRFP